jgi:2,4-dienoyl-CoA reductase-like NADH-dependent reductase (Old Yellow Enzyme family)/thioredoxin reductase
MTFQKLFEPIQIGRLLLSNRVVSPPLSSGSTKDGFVTDRALAFYKEIARSGVSLVITEDSMVDTPIGKHQIEDVAIDDDKYIPGLARVAKTIKDAGAKAAITISHAGRMGGRVIRGSLLITKGLIPVAPSSIPTPSPGYTVPRELTIEEIQEIEDKFAQAVRRAMEAGFDAVSFHCTHLYLIQQFLSPASNKRQDMYGGDFNRRLRFLMEIIRKSKKLVGDDYPLMCRIAGEEVWEGGLTIEDARETSRRLEAAGVCALSVCLGSNPNVVKPNYIPTLTTSDSMRGRHGSLVHLAAAVKDTVSIPVMTANRILTPEHAEEILTQGKADLICIGRGILADNDWLKKTQTGDSKSIRLCIGCHEGCSSSMRGQPITCAVNPLCNREEEFKIIPAATAKTIFVAGGGPAGLEAARVAAIRGHKVTVFEKKKIGGQINLASMMPGKAELMSIVDYEIGQLNRLSVTFENRELTVDEIMKVKPDAVIIATGSRPKTPPIPGSDNTNVTNIWDVLNGHRSVEGGVVIIGGRQFGAETAEYLAAKGHKVTIIEDSEALAEDLRPVVELYNILNFSLRQLGVSIITKAAVQEIRPDSVVVNVRGSTQIVNAGTVILTKNEANTELYNSLQGSGIELHLIGDSNGVSRINKAIREGFRVGLEV